MKSSREITTELEALEKQIAPLLRQLDGIIQRFIKELTPHVKDWMRREVKESIDVHAERLAQGGIEPLRKIKNDLKSLYKETPKICERAAGSSENWPHNRAVKKAPIYGSRYQDPFFTVTFRLCIDSLGVLLHKHELMEDPGTTSSKWAHDGSGGFRYKECPSFNEMEFPSVRTYYEEIRRFKQISEELAVKREEYARARTRELWDEA